jgi:hypothetical protein
MAQTQLRDKPLNQMKNHRKAVLPIPCQLISAYNPLIIIIIILSLNISTGGDPSLCTETKIKLTAPKPTPGFLSLS